MARAPGGKARSTRVATWVTVALVVLLGTEIALATTQSPSPRPPGPAQLLHESLTAAVASDAFHYRAAWRADGVSQIVDGDARPSSGSESVTIGQDHFSVVVTGHVAYFMGNAAALRDQLALPAEISSLSAGTWISLQPSDSAFSSVEEDVTTSAALAEVIIAPTATTRAHESHGVPLTRITGRIPHGRVAVGRAQLDLMARSKLPALYFAHGTNAGQTWSSTITFSRWGVDVTIEPPDAARPFSSLQVSPHPSRTPQAM